VGWGEFMGGCHGEVDVMSLSLTEIRSPRDYACSMEI
jgi:hypothetical protein